MRLYLYEHKDGLDLVWANEYHAIAVEEWFRKEGHPETSKYLRYDYKDVREYEDFNFNSQNEYIKTDLGEA